MTSKLETLFVSENEELEIKGDDKDLNNLLVISLLTRKYYFKKYPGNLVDTLEEFQRTNKQQVYFYLEEYSGFIQRSIDGYRIQLEMVRTDLTKDDLNGVTEAIRDYFDQL
jgi:hypothetical protein